MPIGFGANRCVLVVRVVLPGDRSYFVNGIDGPRSH